MMFIVNSEKEEINDEDYDYGVEKIDYSVKVTKEEQIEALEKTTTQLKEEIKKEKGKLLKRMMIQILTMKLYQLKIYQSM
jgi:hypothetical protein